MGDSFAAGIGAGSMIRPFGETCYRFDGSYPVVLDGHLQSQPLIFNFVACSGDKFPAIIQKQFRDQPSSVGRPNWGDKPEFLTLSMGGNDIGFKELVSTCVYSLRLFTPKVCAEAIVDSQRRVSSRDFITDATNAIITALRKGTSRVGPNFKVYGTGYAQFFNEQTRQCNDVSLKPSWSPLAKQYLTIERRQTLNRIARDLNVVLREAVMTASIGAPNRVFFVDYDTQFNGHRFCDREEPNPKDPHTWFFTLGSNDTAIGDFLNSIPQIHDLLSGQSNETISDSDFLQLISQAADGDERKMENGVAVYRVFHPKSVGHRAIEGKLRCLHLPCRLSTQQRRQNLWGSLDRFLDTRQEGNEGCIAKIII